MRFRLQRAVKTVSVETTITMNLSRNLLNINLFVIDKVIIELKLVLGIPDV